MKEQKSKPKISIIVPVYKEAGNIKPTIKNVLEAVDDLFLDYEILIIDCLDKNGKDDGTARIADELSESDPHIKAIHNPYVDLGYKFWQGIGMAKYEYVTWVPGDNETTLEAIEEIFKAVGKTDIICSYTVNKETRPMKRRIISRIYTFILNTLFGLKLRYFNGLWAYKTEALRALPLSTKENKGFSSNAEMLIRFIKKGYSYMEVPMIIQPRGYGKAKALALGNWIDVIKRIGKLFWEMEILGKK